jgi:hypothetical protein
VDALRAQQRIDVPGIEAQVREALDLPAASAAAARSHGARVSAA